ncbi:hypothetical protein GALL_438580 [mine drainage metagenome]|uniref:Uncharacterized protein n=1 Tax=mine drainage metagenome TaxID=410659 RepID=A0A1J5PTM3_9ZZZZ
MSTQIHCQNRVLVAKRGENGPETFTRLSYAMYDYRDRAFTENLVS